MTPPESLIEALEAAKMPVPETMLEDHRMAKINFNSGLEEAIAIVRQHFAASEQMIDSRAKFDEWTNIHSIHFHTLEEAYELWKAAIAAMGYGGATIEAEPAQPRGTTRIEGYQGYGGGGVADSRASGSASEISLLPCPFCGGEAKLFGNVVACKDCDACVPNSRPYQRFSPECEKHIIEKWNRRKPEPVSVAVVEAAKMALRDLKGLRDKYGIEWKSYELSSVQGTICDLTAAIEAGVPYVD